MDALIYTKDQKEYEMLVQILQEEARVIDIWRAKPEGFGHVPMDYEYDLVIVGIDGEEAKETIQYWKKTYADVQLIWISSDRKQIEDAFRYHCWDYFDRPYNKEEIRKSIRNAIPKCPKRNIWHLRPKAAGK